MLNPQTLKLALVGLDLLTGTQIRVVQKDVGLGVAVVEISSAEEALLSYKAHGFNRCGGYEIIQDGQGPALLSTDSKKLLGLQTLEALKAQVAREDALSKRLGNTGVLSINDPSVRFDRKSEIDAAVAQVTVDNVGETIRWFSAFPTRYNKGSAPNTPVTALKDRISQVIAGNADVTVELIAHQSTPQKSIRVRIPGTTRPQEVVVFGGHLDSINQSFGGSNNAPGADDNASGTASLIEALRIFVAQKRPERTVEFFFYAGEESGLLGSAEIAKDYKTRNVDVVSVLQLDMTLFPGSGEFVLGSMTDFTSAWLRNVLVEINRLYVNARIEDGKCGYGCSDHASWFRQGYPTVMPFEARFGDVDQSNHNIHTSRDVIDARSSFAHAAMFSKLALSMAMELGNSTVRSP